MTYVYSVMKFVPDPARGEAVNFGALAGDDETGDWELRTISNFGRVRSIDDRNAFGAALSFIDDIERHIAALGQLPEFTTERLSRGLLERWSEEMRNVVQFTLPAPVVAASAADALDLIFDELLVDPARREYRFLKKHRAVASTAEAYRRVRLPEEAIAKKLSVEAGEFHDTFDFGVHNGRMVQLVRCWSFQLPGQSELAEEVKAWAWVVERIREQGGRAVDDSRSFDLERGDLDIAVVYVPPNQEERSPAFEEASAAFDALQIRAVDTDHADNVAEEAMRRLAVSSHR